MVSDPSSHRPAAIAAFIGPILLLAAIAYHPFILFLTNDSAVVDELSADTTRWFIAHMAVAIGAAGVLLAFLGVRAHIRRTVGHEPWTARAIAPLVLGTVLFVMLPGMEIAMLAPHQAGADMQATQEALNTWFRPTLLAGSFFFGVGSILFAHGIRRANILPQGAMITVVTALVLSAVSRFVPMTPSLLLGAASLVVAFGVLGATMWKASAVGKPAAQASA